MSPAPGKTAAGGLALFKAPQPLSCVLAEEAAIPGALTQSARAEHHTVIAADISVLSPKHICRDVFLQPPALPCVCKCQQRREPTQGEHRRDSPKIALHFPQCQMGCEGRWCCTEPEPALSPALSSFTHYVNNYHPAACMEGQDGHTWGQQTKPLPLRKCSS